MQGLGFIPLAMHVLGEEKLKSCTAEAGGFLLSEICRNQIQRGMSRSRARAGETALSEIKIAELGKVQTLPWLRFPRRHHARSLHKFSLLNSSESGSKMTANKDFAKNRQGFRQGSELRSPARAEPVLGEPRDGNVGASNSLMLEIRFQAAPGLNKRDL